MSNSTQSHPTAGERPLVSLVVPAYNESENVAGLVQLAADIGQANPGHRFELIVVDDGSTDESSEIARRAGATVLANARNSGDGPARNRGIAAATGDVVCFLDADDVWLPRHIETVVGLLDAHPEASASFAAVQRFGCRNETILGGVPFGPPCNVLREAFADWVHTTIGSCVRRSAIAEIGGFDEQERYSTDFDFWLRLAEGRLFVATRETTSCWRWHGQNQSTQRHQQMAAVYRFRRQFLDQLRGRGEHDTARLLAADMPHIWRREMMQAWAEGDTATLGFLQSEGARTFGIPISTWMDHLLHRYAREAVVVPLKRLAGGAV
jgi:glycosyltransferase involved in cell wall biosynthesis